MLLLFGPSTIFACTCVDPGRDTEDKVIDALCAVDVVFIGEATELSTKPYAARHVRIEPITVYRGKVRRRLIVEAATTCDHWFKPNQKYLVFGEIGADETYLSSSICGPTRYTAPLDRAQYQQSIIENHFANIDELCGSAESGARQIRIIRQNRADREHAEAESLRLLKESVRRDRDEYQQALESARSTSDNSGKPD